MLFIGTMALTVTIQTMKISEILLKYDTDKVRKNGSGHSYGEAYDELLEPYRNKPIMLLEIGVQKGASLLAWKECFPLAEVYGVDIVDERKYLSDSVHFILSDIKSYQTDKTFDVIIDDGSHQFEDVDFVVRNYIDKLNPGGVLIIEDVQEPISWVYNVRKIAQGSVETRDMRNLHGYGDDFLIIIRK